MKIKPLKFKKGDLAIQIRSIGIYAKVQGTNGLVEIVDSFRDEPSDVWSDADFSLDLENYVQYKYLGDGEQSEITDLETELRPITDEDIEEYLLASLNAHLIDNMNLKEDLGFFGDHVMINSKMLTIAEVEVLSRFMRKMS